MVPVMTGGVFWEHLHRLVAGGLILMLLLATWIARKETRDRPWIFKTCVAAVVLIFVQAVFGGLTVLLKLPPVIATAHLTLALLFLGLVTVLASATTWSPDTGSMRLEVAGGLRRWSTATAGLVLAQCVLGGAVRHLNAAMACPDAPLCLGHLIPPLDSGLVALQFFHRVMALLVLTAVSALAVWTYRAGAPPVVRSWATWAVALVLVQIGLGITTVLTALAVVPDAFHTLVAASIFAILVHLTTIGWMALTHGGEPSTVAAEAA
jgi:cytochrome c oxidase assembly protein subunit 15